MASPTILDGNMPASPEAISNFEEQRCLKLPPSYRRFLSIVNGGVPVQSAFPIAEYASDTHGNVKVFLSIGSRYPTEELAYAYDLYTGGLPDKIIPIACDDIGNYVCLDLRNNSDSVVFWDHRHYWSTGEFREQDLYRVADTFEAFLNSLRVRNETAGRPG
jgi:hypothetical protein